MKLGAAFQQPDETIDYDFYYSDWFGENDTDELTEFTASVTPSGPTLVPLIIAESVGKIWVSGCMPDETYYLELTAVTRAGRIKQDELEIICTEIE